jgi:hypothetical protein
MKAKARPPEEAGAEEPQEPEPVPVGPLASRQDPARPVTPEPAPAKPAPARPEPAKPEPKVESKSEPGAGTEQAASGSEVTAGSGAAEPAQTDAATDALIADALKERLHVAHRVRNGVLDVEYRFADQADRQDWDGRGWDKFEVDSVMGLATEHATGCMGLELGAGSNGMGIVNHAIEFAGDFTIEMDLWAAHSSSRSQFVILCGKAGGVRWGSQLVKVSRGGGMKPLGAEPDRMCFRAEQTVSIKITRRGDVLEVTLNGAKCGQKGFKPGELDGRIGLLASDVRLVVTRFKLTGKVDAKKL